MRAGGGADFVDDGAGNDLLTGGAGRDTFYFLQFSWTGQDHITDYTANQDVLVFGKFQASDVTITRQDAYTLITLDAQTAVLIDNIRPGELDLHFG